MNHTNHDHSFLEYLAMNLSDPMFWVWVFIACLVHAVLRATLK